MRTAPLQEPQRPGTNDSHRGNLSTKSLISIVDPKTLIRDSDYLETHLIAVPKNAVKDYYKTYETLCPMIVPRSSIEVDADDEFTLMAVTTFRKYGAEFVHKAREKRWTPRDFKYEEGARRKEGEEVVGLTKEERRLWGETLRLGSTGYSESAMTWMHVQALRVFVETVLRYGLPAEFVCGIVEVGPSLLAASWHSCFRVLVYLLIDVWHADETVFVPRNRRLRNWQREQRAR